MAWVPFPRGMWIWIIVWAVYVWGRFIFWLKSKSVREVDNVLFLRRNEMCGIAEFIIARSKHGPRATVDLEWEANGKQFFSVGDSIRREKVEEDFETDAVGGANDENE